MCRAFTRFMQKEKLIELCEQAAVEQDSQIDGAD